MWAARYSAPAGGGLLASQKRSGASSSDRITRSRRRCNHPHGNSRPSRASPGSRPTNARSSVNSCSGPAAPPASAGRAPAGGGGSLSGGGGAPGGGGGSFSGGEGGAGAAAGSVGNRTRGGASAAGGGPAGGRAAGGASRTGGSGASPGMPRNRAR